MPDMMKTPGNAKLKFLVLRENKVVWCGMRVCEYGGGYAVYVSFVVVGGWWMDRCEATLGRAGAGLFGM